MSIASTPTKLATVSQPVPPRKAPPYRSYGMARMSDTRNGTSLHPALEAAKEDLLNRRSQRQRPGYNTAATARHDPLQEAYRGVGAGRYLRILYCPCCLRGHVVDLVRELPADAVMARELGIRQMRPWRLDCAEKHGMSAIEQLICSGLC